MTGPILRAGAYELELAPEQGGSVARLEWNGEPLLRPLSGETIFDVACFPLVPFSNRIANGRFVVGANIVRIAPNFPGSDHPHPLHGFGWLSAWVVADAGSATARLVHDYPGGEWPWAYRAEQQFHLDENGLVIELSVTNSGRSPMPAGLGFHPYLPRDADMIYHGLHRGEWQNDQDCLPLRLDERAVARDWWNGAPLGSRDVDTGYSGRDGDLAISWPSRGIKLVMRPCARLDRTVVYTPAGEPYACIEPVSNDSDGINQRSLGGMVLLAPGERLGVTLAFSASSLEPARQN